MRWVTLVGPNWRHAPLVLKSPPTVTHITPKWGYSTSRQWADVEIYGQRFTFWQ
ncbi:hypothetical protein Scani_33770 [Streptomyces caniferus]|uniref:Uncharacterized protein n=1 Tax=Streptomyces caniferus TaxID=285557 RepID=A0A640S792_9ACTN|nr:hypothetical protein Scani_33770 [Streptomyces caniferus]